MMGFAVKYDISMNIKLFEDCVKLARNTIKANTGKYTHTVGYGHLGDGNLHLDVACKTLEDKYEV